MTQTPDTPPLPETRSRAAPVLLTLVTMALAGGAAWLAATRITDEIETRSAAQVRAALAGGAMGWVRVSTDGLSVRLSGTAPDEVARFRAISAAGAEVDGRRIIDDIRLAERSMLAAPDFSLELMRQGNAVSALGLVPARPALAGVMRGLGASGAEVTDLTGTVAYPAPDGWQAALDFAIRAAALMDQGTVSVTPGAVRITANAASADARDRLAAALASAAPDGVEVTTTISAPLPVIAPYVLRLVLADGAATLERCAADSENARARILAAVPAAGEDAAALSCELGIGAPPGWDEAAGTAITALARAGAGTLDITGTAIRLTLPDTTAPEMIEAEAARIRAALPAAFSLRIESAEPPPPEGPARFFAVVGQDGQATVSGVVPDETMRQTVGSLARAQLGAFDGALTLDPALPEGWPARVMAGLDAIGIMDSGRLEVTPALISIEGISGDPQAAPRAVLALSERLGAGVPYSLAISYDRHLDPAVTLPDGTECVDRLNAVMLESEIGFEPGGATIAGDTDPVIGAMRAIMEDCADYRIEIAGHTDAQGRAETNLALSVARAEAVLEAMRGAGLDIRNLTAAGYGATRPVAENDTEEGREANRRIEMTLIAPDPLPAALPEARAISGTTPGPQAAARALATAAPDMMADGDTDVMLPALSLDSGPLAAPPAIEPPATVLTATPDTPRPPGRPGDAPDGGGANDMPPDDMPPDDSPEDTP